jgi:oligoendopeptidase F
MDYSIADCLQLHEAVEKIVKPVYEKLMQERKARLGLERLRPWDLSVDIYGQKPLAPFQKGKDLIEKSIQVFAKIRPELADMVSTLNQMHQLDLESRPGKAPGGYNHPLSETGAPFIFMNAAGTQDDMNTMMHEAGHAFHSFLTHTLELNEFKNTPSEIAELASMSMELISASHWDIFYPNQQELVRARIDHLGNCLSLLCWVATVDSFQHWLYANPQHSHQAREEAWVQCYQRFQGDIVDWSDLEQERALIWQKQLHIYEVPFYYIEYGLAQLGALGVWKNYIANPEKAVDQYLNALKLGYTRSIPEVYATAGVQFNFSPEYIQEIMDFGISEWEKLKAQLT